MRRFLIAALLGAVAIAVAGCGGSEVDIEAPSTTVYVASPTAGGASATESVSMVDPEESEARLAVPAKAPFPVAVVEGVAVSGEPFTRSGGPVQAEPATELIVRGHMSTGGYGPTMRGSPATGFAPADLPADFARSVESAPPLPEGCAG